MQHKNAPEDTPVGEHSAESMPGRAQIPVWSRIDADVAAIRELQERIEQLWGDLMVPAREDLSARLGVLGAAADHRATNSRQVREALQAVLLSIGTGALAVLSERTRQRLAALTGITLPGHLSPAGPGSAAEIREAGDSAPSADQLAELPAATAEKGAEK
jgi:hypothetical protein